MVVSTKMTIDTQFLNVLMVVKKRHGMFMERACLKDLRVFISGYASVYMFENNIESDFFGAEPKFFKWLDLKTGNKTSPSKGWDKVLMERCESELEGFNLFFEYLNEFLEIQKLII